MMAPWIQSPLLRTSLSLAGAEKETPPLRDHAIMMDYYRSLSLEEKTKMHEDALEARGKSRSLSSGAYSNQACCPVEGNKLTNTII
jgi:hypothetical protein